MYESDEQRRDRESEEERKIAREIKRIIPYANDALAVLSQPADAQEMILRARSDALDQWKGKREAEAETERLKNRFGLPNGPLDFGSRELLEAATASGYPSKRHALLAALRQFCEGESRRLSRAEAEEFLTGLLSKSRKRG